MKEYLNVLKRGIGNIKGVTEGWTNATLDKFNLLDENKKKIAEQRLKKCLECPFNSENAKSIGYETSLDYFHCSSCKCPIDKKVFSFDDNCGLEWFMLHPNNDDQKHILEYYRTHNESIELKWKKI